MDTTGNVELTGRLCHCEDKFETLNLKKGQKISTGTLTPVIAAAPGDTLEADFGALGTVAVSFR